MTWMITNTAREHHLAGLGQQFNAPTIEEIAWSLAQINRFTGHALRPYSVAEHSLLVRTLAARDGASPVAQLAALLHDAHEAFVGDVASPVKWTIGEPWEVFEHSQAIAVQNALGIRSAMFSHRNLIKRWDLIALATERRDLTRFNPEVNMPWPILDTPGQVVEPSDDDNLRVIWRGDMDWEGWRDMLLEQHATLERQIRQGA